jgi:DNA-binding transcriptional LysR family regulator
MWLARSGLGIAAAVTDHFCVKSGELGPVLDDWTLPEVSAWAVFPGRRLMPARTRVFLGALEAEFSGVSEGHAQVAADKNARLRIKNS